MFLVAALVSTHGEDFVAPQDPAETPVIPIPVAPQPSFEGIVAAIFKNRQPWQLINPLAPAEYGDGEAFVSRNPDDPEKPKGFIFFGIEW